MNNNYLNFIFSISPIIISIAGIFIFNFIKKFNKQSFNILSFLFLGLIYFQFQRLVYLYFNNFNIVILMTILFVPIILTFAPLIYLFTKSLTKSKNKNHYISHFIIPLSALILTSIYILFFRKNTLYFSFIQVLVIFIFPIQNIYYFYLSTKDYFNYKKEINNIFSYEENINLNWLKYILFFYFIFILSCISAEIINSEKLDLILDISLLVFIISVNFVSIKYINNNIELYFNKLNNNNPEKTEIIELETEDEKYKSSSLKDKDDINKIKEDLLNLMENEKPYLNPNLNIFLISELLNVNYKYISQVVNNELNSNFISFINKYRIKEAQILLKSKKIQNYTIESIAEMAGFKSKSTFNSAFKKQTGLTPSEFKNN